MGDRFGYRRVLGVSVVVASITLALLPLAGSLPLLIINSVVLGACISVFTAMIFSMLAVETPEDRRSATLNLVYLPIYLSGILGPIVAGIITRLTGSLWPIFILAGLLYASSLLPLMRGGDVQEEERAAA